jgi:hypothetical protein
LLSRCLTTDQLVLRVYPAIAQQWLSLSVILLICRTCARISFHPECSILYKLPPVQKYRFMIYLLKKFVLNIKFILLNQAVAISG